MTAKYDNVLRQKSTGNVSAETLGAARLLVGRLLEAAHFAKLKVLSMQSTAPDGSKIVASLSDGITPQVIITPSARAVVKAPSVVTSMLWVPRGFLVYPVSMLYPGGVGLPIKQLGDDPYAPDNLAPGLDTSRWTAGGPWGQVLLTKDANAGYPAPDVIAAPISYTNLGATFHWGKDVAFDVRPDSGSWSAFRAEFTDFVSHYEDDDSALRRAAFKVIADYIPASDHCGSPGILVPRGYYKSAESTSYFMTENSVSVPVSVSYSPHYGTPEVRLTKDGYLDGSALSTASWYVWQPWETALDMYEMLSTGGDVSSTTRDWYNLGYLDQGNPSVPLVVDVGCRAGNWAATIQGRTQWIGAGRRAWQSADADLPPISWETPSALNTSFFTLPLSSGVASPGGAASFDLLAGGMFSDGHFYARHPQSLKINRPLLGRAIYARGRAIAEVPSGGFVLGAGIVSTPGNDRLIVVSLVTTEQAGTWEDAGVTNKAHVWYADYPYASKQLRLHSQVIPNATTTGWVDGGAVSLPGMKYESLWEFSATGERAVCLRDVGTLADYYSMANAALADYHYVYIFTGSGKGAIVELTFDGVIMTVSATTTTLSSGGPMEYRTVSELPHAPPGLPPSIFAAENQLSPIAAGYDSSGNVQIAFMGNAALFASGHVTVDGVDITMSEVDYIYTGTGVADTVWPSELANLTLTSANVSVPELDYMFSGMLQCVDIGDAVFVCDGAPPKFAIDYSTYTNPVGGPGPESTATYSLNSTWPACMLNTSDAVRSVRLHMRGALYNMSSYSHESSVMWNLMDLGYRVDPAVGSTRALVIPDSGLSAQMTAFYAKRFGDWLLGYQIGMLGYTTDNVTGICAPNVDQYVATFYAPNGEFNYPDGGFVRSSFTLPSNVNMGWFNEVLVV